MPFTETINQTRADALYCYVGLVEQATAGFVTADLSESHGLRLARTDGGVLETYEAFGESHDITGVLTGIHPFRPIDKRNKVALRELRDAVRSFIVKYNLIDDSKVLQAFCNFEYVYKVGY